jgi:crossover junction endodeoxyribonuclease RuvC
MIITGIDPGLKGGITVLDFKEGTIQVYRMPVTETVKRVKGKNKKTSHYDLPRLFEVIPLATETFMERVGAMPGQGVSSTWRFAEGYGLLKSAIYGQNHRIATLVGPSTWKKYFELSDDKNLSRTRALELFPLAAPGWKSKRAKILDEGVTESALIAAWGSITKYNVDPAKFATMTNLNIDMEK